VTVSGTQAISESVQAGYAGLWLLVKSDLAAWRDLFAPESIGRRLSPSTAVRLICAYAGLRASLVYRLAHHLQRRRIPIVPTILTQVNLTLHGLDVVPSVAIGPRFYAPHPMGTVIMARRLGAGVTVVSGVTIGMRKGHAFPTIGDDVYIGAGARILGGITVGNRVSVGANAVVLNDVPDDSVAVGVPASVRPARRGSPIEATGG